jgi:hypothetical protein
MVNVRWALGCRPSSSSSREEEAMSGIRAFVLLAGIAALGALCTASAGWAQHVQKKGFQGGTGHLKRCSLTGVNPVHHPDVFGDAAVAKSYGFVQSKDGKWHVSPELCHRRH